MQAAICVATYLRPVMLGELLEGLRALDLTNQPDVGVRVIVVDNDADGSARGVVQSHRHDFPSVIDYLIEPKRGIAHARNAAIASALAGGADVIALIDDDEVPASDWLAQLLRTHATYGADAVYGPVLSRFAEPPPRWIAKGRFFERPIAPTGERVPIGATGNVLLSRRILERSAPVFDPAFALTGGEDTHFFLTLQRDDIDVISCAEAVVVETVPPSRTTLNYLLRRAYAGGSAYTAVERTFTTSPAQTTRRAAIGVFRLATGLLFAATRGLGGRHHAVRGLQISALGLGMLAALRGSRYEPYRITEGM